MEEKKLIDKLAGVLALPGLTTLALVRLWAVLGGKLPGRVLAPAALVLAVACVAVAVRFSLVRRYALPFGTWWKNLLVFLPAFLVGGALDTSYAMFDGSGLLVAALPIRILCHGGSGIFFGVLVLALVKAARDYGHPPKVDGRTLLGLALLFNVLGAVYVAGSATVYIWDTAGYWSVAGNLARAPLGFGQLRQVLESVITLDYNYLLAFPISLVMRFLGTGRYVFVLSVVNLYLMPGIWALCALSRRVERGGGAMLALSLPMLAYTAVVGFVDVAAAACALWAYVVYTDEKRPAAARGVLAGVLLVLTFLLRRYFFFFAVSFGAAALLKKLFTGRKQWADWLALLLSGASGGIFFAQSFLVEKVLRSSYGETYSAYALGLRSDVMLFCRYFGWAFLFLTVVLGLFLLVFRPAARGEAILALGQMILCFALFTRVQSHGQQHLLMYLPGLAAILSRAMGEALDWKEGRWWAWALTATIAISPLIPREQPATISEIRIPSALPSFSYQGPRRSDLMDLIALRCFVDSLSAREEKTAAVVSSSLLFNCDTYENLLPSLDIPLREGPKTRMLYVADVDKRDGFSWNALSADYLIVANPVQTHLGEDNQQVMALLAHDLLDGTGPGAAFRPLKTKFTLQNGAKISIYERTRAVTLEEYRSVSDRLTALYPEYEALYRVPEELVK